MNSIPYYHLLALNVPTEAKYFLAVFLREFGCEGHASLKAQELSKVLELNCSTAKKNIDLLVDEGLLNREKIKHAKGGRPSYKYRSSEQLNQHLTQIDNSESVHHQETLIGKVLSKNFSKGKKNNKSVLKPPAKVLLAALLLRANKRGIVKELEKGDLEQLSGMSKERLKSQIRLLAKTEYLNLYIHGMVNNPIFGSTKSIYILNFALIPTSKDLQHLILYCKDAHYFVNQTVPDEEEHTDNTNLYDENSHITLYPIDIDEHFPQRAVDNIKKLLAFKIHAHTIDVLREDFDKNALDNETSDQRIKDNLKKEFFPNVNSEKPGLISIPKDKQNDLVEWAFMVLSHIANEVRKANEGTPIHHDIKKAIFMETIAPDSIMVSMEK